jgi:hypothetical protein
MTQAGTGIMAANGYKEDGWRAASPTRLGQWFGKLGWADRNTDISSSAVSSSNLTGNGLQEVRLLERDYASVYTRPDQTHNHGLLLARRPAIASQQLQLAANAYYRRLHSDSLNGDMNDDALDQSVYQPNAAEQAALAAAGYTGYPPKVRSPPTRPSPTGAAWPTLRKDEPAEKCNGLSQPQRQPAAQRRLQRSGHRLPATGPACRSSSRPAWHWTLVTRSSASPRNSAI